MAKLVQTLIPLISSIALLLLLATAQSQEGPFTFFSYEFNGAGPTPALYYLNDAHFPSNSTYLRLTGTYPWGSALTESIGRVTFPLPLNLAPPSGKFDFETTVKFIITPQNDQPADGLTFFIYPRPDGMPVDSTGSGLGIFGESEADNANTFAVEFDTFFNQELDPANRHVGIDIGSKRSRNATEIGDSLVGQNVTANIKYAWATNLITVRVTAGWRTYEVSYVHDLSILFPERVWVGLSASTGGFVALHDIISWDFYLTFWPNDAPAGIRSAI